MRACMNRASHATHRVTLRSSIAASVLHCYAKVNESVFVFKSCSWLNFPSADRSVGWCSDVQLQTRWLLAHARWSCGIFTLLLLYVLHHRRWKHRNAPCMPTYPLFATRSVFGSHVLRLRASWIKTFSRKKKKAKDLLCAKRRQIQEGQQKNARCVANSRSYVY